MPPHLFIDISAHGFGHLAQTAPVLNALHQRLPDVRFTIRSLLPPEQLQSKLTAPFQHLAKASDFGLCMHNAVDVDVTASLVRYTELHTHWAQQIADYAAELRASQPDLLLSNVSYLALAAAQQARIPALAMSSLNWYDIFHPYLDAHHQHQHLLQEMLDAYNSAPFLRLTPGMQMPALQNLQAIGPVAARGTAQIEKLRAHAGLASQTKVILFAMGGMHMPTPRNWPHAENIVWLMPRANAIARSDVRILENIEMPFSDLLASCDAVITKSGYGVFTEATLVGTPVLYLERPDWPEQHCLAQWLHQYNLAHAMTREEFESGAFIAPLQDLLAQTRAPGLAPSGIATAVDYVMEKLRK